MPKGPYRYLPSEEEPWWAEVSGTTDRLRYARAMRLTAMRRDLARPRRAGRRPVPGYRERCIAEWRHYLQHGTPPDPV